MKAVLHVILLIKWSPSHPSAALRLIGVILVVTVRLASMTAEEVGSSLQYWTALAYMKPDPIGEYSVET